MVQVHLKKILNWEVRTLIQSLVAMNGSNVLIQDDQGLTLMGDVSQVADRYPITISGRVMGWVIGGPQVAPVAAFLSVLAAKEWETKSLAQEVLNNYREMNLVRKIAEKLASCGDVVTVAQLAVKEVHHLHRDSTAALLLLDRHTCQLQPIVTIGGESSPVVPLGQGIIGSIALSGQGEIVNDVRADARFAPTDLPAHALVCVPLKHQEQVTALLQVSCDIPYSYEPESLLVLRAIAAQTAPVLERMLHRTQSPSQIDLNQRQSMSDQMSYQVQVDELARRNQILQITESDFFKKLEEKAEEFRNSMNR